MSEDIKKKLLVVCPVVAVFIVGILVFTGIFKKDTGNGSTDKQVVAEQGDLADVKDAQQDNNETTDTDDVYIDDETSNTNTSSNGFQGIRSNGVNNTGNLTEFGSGYEGVKGTGKYNYGEALQKSLLFYELQRSGDLPDETRCNWRGDSALLDGSDVGLDLTGGWFDAGDNVKFNLPMAYTASMLGWSLYQDQEAYKEAGQLEYALSNVKWANDYFIKCHPEDEVYYYQLGDGNQDHTYWGAAETVEYRMDRPAYKVTKSEPGSAVCGETAASLAICSILYKDVDSAYSSECLKHAKSLYKFARDTKSDDGYTAANGFYNSWSGFYDELAWAGAWLYLATDDDTYLKNAEADYPNGNQDYNWAMCWDDVHIGAAMMLADITKKDVYKDAVEKHLDWWTEGVDGERITYTPDGLAWLDSWGSLRYATTTGFLAAAYSQNDLCSDKKKDIYWDFAVSQAGYALGDTGFSYEIGFGDDYPQNPHHRTAQGSYCDNMNEPSTARHTLYGALVGGPDASDNYQDEVSNYTNNEVACDYNAGFTGLLAKLYKEYHGQTLKDFGAVESVDEDELYVSGGINVEGQDFIEIKAYITNVSAWPARVPENLEFRYYMDLSEVYEDGGDASDIVVTTNYMQAGNASDIVCLDEDKHIYYLSVDFSGDAIYPGGQDKYKKEIQVRIRNEKGVWDNDNDPSFYNMTSNGNELLVKTGLYENGKLVFGEEPASGNGAGQKVESLNASNDNTEDKQDATSDDNNDKDDNDTDKNTDNNKPANTKKPTTIKNVSADNKVLKVDVDYSNMQSKTTSLSGIMNIKNNSDDSYDLKKLTIEYYFTNDSGKELTFACYHSAINGKNGSYNGVSGCTGKYAKATGEDTDTMCLMGFNDKMSLNKGDTLTVNFCINYSDWSEMDAANDYSVLDAAHIVICDGDKVIFGERP